MNAKTAQKLGKRLQQIWKLGEYQLACLAIRYVELGHPDFIVGSSDITYKDITAGEYLTKRNLWNLVSK